MPKRIYIIEDHEVVRWGYAFLIKQEADLDVCGEAATASEALRDMAALAPDVALVDLRLEEMSGIELIKRLTAQQPNLPMLAVSALDEALYAERTLRAGANGYVMKTDGVDDVLTGLRCVLNGERYVSDRMSTRLLDRQLGGAAQPQTADGHPSTEQLTDRELEMFEHLGRGHTRRRIAEAMHISPKTVDTYRERVKNKLGLSSSTELARRATTWLEHSGTG